MSSIVITGFMGCGKTEVARHLARVLLWKAIDLDDVITQREGKSPARLISEDGEGFFRERETAALSNTLNSVENAVIALGGGAWIQEQNRDLIRQNQAVAVWLDVPFDVCWQRITESKEDRPLGKTKSQAQELFDQRLPIYRLAPFHFEHITGETASEIALRITQRFNNVK